ncbi:hypothetical protein QYF36_008362 [Acer negundo]|nr:hypothetical protein QYF36_008362 [Acer negundo]
MDARNQEWIMRYKTRPNGDRKIPSSQLGGVDLFETNVFKIIAVNSNLAKPGKFSCLLCREDCNLLSM